MKIVAIRYSTGSSALVSSYRALGFPVDVLSRTGDWIELAGSSAAIAVHTTRPDEQDHDSGAVE